MQEPVAVVFDRQLQEALQAGVVALGRRGRVDLGGLFLDGPVSVMTEEH